MEPFPTDDWRLIERFAQEGILKQEVWSSLTVAWGQSQDRDSALWNRIQRQAKYFAH